jgi:hypothetical protein
MSLREKLESWFHKDVVEVLVGLEERVARLESKAAVPLPPEMPALAAAVPRPADVPPPPDVEDHDNP